MRVHMVDRSGSGETIECESIWEADHGIYLMDTPSQNLRNAVGYVPFDRLDYVEPGEE